MVGVAVEVRCGRGFLDAEEHGPVQWFGHHEPVELGRCQVWVFGAEHAVGGEFVEDRREGDNRASGAAVVEDSSERGEPRQFGDDATWSMVVLA
jgi:hypothetical protein